MEGLFLAGGLGELRGGTVLMLGVKEWLGFRHGAGGAGHFRWGWGGEERDPWACSDCGLGTEVCPQLEHRAQR